MFISRNSRRLRLRLALFHILVVVAVLLLPTPANSQKDSSPNSASPKYDSATEATLKGTVDEFKFVEVGQKKQIATLVLKSSSGSLDVYVCPKSFLDDMGVSFAKGDAVEITGSKIKQGEQEEVLAREIVKGNDTLVLRDKSGKPVW